MQLGLYSTALAPPRLSSVFKVSCLGKMIMGRGMKLSADGNFKSQNTGPKSEYSNVGEQMLQFLGEEKEGSQPQLPESSQTAYEEGFPPLSASVSSMPKSKRRTRVDLETFSERKPEKNGENIGPSQLEASTSVSHQNNDSCLPTSFGKKRVPSASRSPKLCQTYHVRGESKRSSMNSPGINTDEPFDICLPEAMESSVLKNSVDEMNFRKWVPKVQPAEENGQHKHSMEEKNNSEHSVEEIGQVLRPGMVLLKQYIPLSEQVNIVNKCRELGLGQGGFYRPGYNDGAKLRLYMMCLGQDWDPQTKKYTDKRRHDDAAPPDIPPEFTSLVSRVLDDSHDLIKKDSKTVNAEEILPRMSPDVCIVNFYTTNGRLGLHQDRDESQESLRKGFPVVSISVGDSAEFLYGDQRGVDKAEHVLLESGDVLVFGGGSRHIFHGVKSITPNTVHPALLENVKLRPGRLNLTFRKY
ncbi:hypothetical protein BUALT_Bualt09G0133600 [Buddleja alternifolia]|uniref:DNA N(6)-methyladenine demethylase n=1 Tax=Buddleja alternifolia TaxID=168488 RepID=A0AAV6XAW1_9LAMI|nr:hypothetical protein BUALT_Bualt09G0133600 [Buddleja alternifolia]